VIVGTSIILLALSYDLSTAEARASHKLRIAMDSTGAILFAGIGLLALLAGGLFMDFGAIPLPMPPAEVRGIMILLIGVAIGIHIMALAASLFLHLAEEDEPPLNPPFVKGGNPPQSPFCKGGKSPSVPLL
jgi:multicomponent Na+:H+ antiporter subunit B